MPLRGLMYFSKMYDRYVVEHSYNIYGSTLVKIPTPRYTVLYNGTSRQPAFMKIKLSDAFIHEDTSGDFEWTANMVNINHGMNDELLNNCRPLQEYMLLIEEIRKNRSDGMEVEQAVDKAVTYCISNNILSEFLTKHRAEVIDVCITEYDEQAFVNGIREEGRQEGREEGRALTLFSLVNSGNLKPDIAAKELGISIHEFEIAMKEAGMNQPVSK